MNWTKLITSEIEKTYRATDGLLALVDDDGLGWKPQTGDNWMTTGQLLRHIETSCGFCCRGFVTGDWRHPDSDASDASVDEMSPEDMLPPAEKLPTASSVAESRAALAADRQVALDMVTQAGEADLDGKLCTAPWDPTPRPLGQHLLEMVGHLASHKSQLFYYLKLQGKPVHTGTLWGMG